MAESTARAGLRSGRAALGVLLAVGIVAGLAGCSGGGGSGGGGFFIATDANLGGDAGDSPGSADSLGVLPVFGTAVIQGYLTPDFDDDWYFIDVDVAPGETLVISLSPPAFRDYDLTILDDRFNLLAVSAGIGDDDEVIFISGYSGLLFIGVEGAFGDADAFDPYVLSIDHQP